MKKAFRPGTAKLVFHAFEFHTLAFISTYLHVSSPERVMNICRVQLNTSKACSLTRRRSLCALTASALLNRRPVNVSVRHGFASEAAVSHGSWGLEALNELVPSFTVATDFSEEGVS